MSRLLAVALPLVMLSLVSQATGARTTFPGRDGAVVFESDREGNYELYVANAVYQAVRKLVELPDTDEFNAAWSPSGSGLVFQTGQEGGEFDVALVSANGTGFRTLVGGSTIDFAAQFCDENTIVFTRQQTPTNSEIYRIETNGSGLVRLTDDPARDSFPTCSPDGRTIAFISSREGGQPGIFAMNPDGSNARRLVPGVGLDPDFSPEGRSLVYAAPDANRNPELFIFTLGTGRTQQLTFSNPPFEYRLPEFTPSSTQGAPAVLATLRNQQTGAKEVRRIAAGTEQTAAAPASSASVQPQPRPCRCQNVDALIEPNSLDIISDSRNSVRMRGRLRWTLDCTLGAGRCDGVVSAELGRDDVRFEVRTRSGLPELRERLLVACRGPCARRTRGMQTFQLLGRGVDIGRGRRGTIVRRLTLFLRRTCGETSLRPREFIIVFAPDGRIDRARSDLNGDGRRDGND